MVSHSSTFARTVAVVLSGSGSTREHIQRLGRILRKQADKEAILYEVVTADTAEERISERRRDANQFRETKDEWIDGGWEDA